MYLDYITPATAQYTLAVSLLLLYIESRFAHRSEHILMFFFASRSFPEHADVVFFGGGGGLNHQHIGLILRCSGGALVYR